MARPGTCSGKLAGKLPPVLAVLVLVALSGCMADPDDDLECPPKNTLARVDSIDGTEIRVQVLSPSANQGPAVLHTVDADFFSYAGGSDGCFDSERELLTVGQEIEFFADAWMESYPPQAHVDAIIIRG